MSDEACPRARSDRAPSTSKGLPVSASQATASLTAARVKSDATTSAPDTTWAVERMTCSLRAVRTYRSRSAAMNQMKAIPANGIT